MVLRALQWSAGLSRLPDVLARPGSGLDPDELEQYLAMRGLALVEQVGAAEHRTCYLDPLGRQMQVFEGERAALARVARGMIGLVREVDGLPV